MTRGRRHHLILFLPEDAQGLDWRAELERVFPRLTRIHWPELVASAGPEPERRAALAKAMREAGPRGFVITGPPEDVAELTWIDEVTRETFGRRRRFLPKAIFFAPPRPARAKEPDPHEALRHSLAAPWHHYRKDRRAFRFERTAPRAMRKALKLSRRSRSPVRWGLLLPMSAFAAAVLLLAFVFRDPLLHRGALAAGRSAFGAKVEIAALETLLTPALRLDEVAVADRAQPMRNLFEFDSFVADVDLLSLLAGRVHVGEATLSGLALGTERAESGALEETVVDDEEDGPSELRLEMGRRLDAVIENLERKLEPPAVEDLETTRVARELTEEARERLERLQGRASVESWRERIEARRAELEALIAEPVPPSLQELRDELDALGGAGDVDVAALQAELAGVAALDFSTAEGFASRARERVETARDELASARATLQRAKEVEKIDLPTLAKLPALLKDVEGAIAGARGAVTKVERAGELTQRATNELGRLDARSAEALASLRGSLAEAREAAGDVSGASARIEELGPLLARAEAEVEERRAALLAARAGALEEVDAMRAEVADLRERMRSDVEFLEEGVERLEAAVEQDAEALRRQYSLDAIDTDEILATLVGEKLFGWLDTGWSLYRRFRPARRDGPPERRVGPDGARYVFPAPSAAPGAGPEAAGSPRLRVRRAVFDGVLDVAGRGLAMQGTASELSSNPALVGRDASARFTAEREGESVGGSFRLTAEGALDVELAAADLRVDDVPFESRYAPERIGEGLLSMTLKARFEDETVRAGVDVSLRELAVVAGELEGLDPRLAAVLEAVYTGFDALDARVELEARPEGIDALRVESDALDEIRRAVVEALGAQVAEQRDRAEDELAARLSEARAEAVAAVAEFAPEARALVGGMGGGADEAGALLAGDERVVNETLTGVLDVPDVADPAALRAALEERLDAIGARLEAEAARLESARAAQDEALQAVRGELGAVEETAGGLEDALRAELQRLLKLRR